MLTKATFVAYGGARKGQRASNQLEQDKVRKSQMHKCIIILF